MSETKKLVSAAIATSLAVSGAQAATGMIPADYLGAGQDSDPEMIVLASVDTSDLFFDGIITVPEGEGGLIDTMIDLEPATSVHGADNETDYDLAQTLYGGGGTDGVILTQPGKIQTTKPQIGTQPGKPKADKRLQPLKPDTAGGLKPKKK